MRLSICLLLTIGLSAAIPVWDSDPQPVGSKDPSDPLFVPDCPKPLIAPPGFELSPNGEIRKIEKERGPAIIPIDSGARKIEKRSVDSLVATTRRAGGIAVTLSKRPSAFLSDDDSKPEPTAPPVPTVSSQINNEITPAAPAAQEAKTTTYPPMYGGDISPYNVTANVTDTSDAEPEVLEVLEAETITLSLPTTKTPVERVTTASMLDSEASITKTVPVASEAKTLTYPAMYGNIHVSYRTVKPKSSATEDPLELPGAVHLDLIVTKTPEDTTANKPAQIDDPLIPEVYYPAPRPVIATDLPRETLKAEESTKLIPAPPAPGPSTVPKPLAVPAGAAPRKSILDEWNQDVAKLRYEQEAREYYGKTLNHLKKAEFGEAFDLFAAKLERFFPGILSKELLAKLRGSQQISEDKKAELQKEVTQQAQAYFNQKALALAFNIEAAGYLLSVKTSTTFNDNSTANTPVLRPYHPAFVAARKQFHALSLDAKKALIEAFPHLGMLDELEAYVKVFDDIVVHLKGFCANLPGFEECDKVRALS